MLGSLEVSDRTEVYAFSIGLLGYSIGLYDSIEDGKG